MASSTHANNPGELPPEVTSSAGVKLRLYDLGGTGRPLVFCHATGFCGQVWEPVADRLTDQFPGQFRCIAFDFRGHGRSSFPDDGDMKWSGLADDLRAVRAAVSPAEPVLAVGHSIGGAAIALAETAAVGTIKKAWSFEPILIKQARRDAVRSKSSLAEGARKRRAEFTNREEAFARYAGKPPLSLLDERSLRAYVDHGFADLDDGTITLRCRPETEASLFENTTAETFTRAGQLTIPYAMAASGDGGVPAEAVIEAADEFPQLELIHWPELSHFGPLQAPDAIADQIGAWMLA